MDISEITQGRTERARRIVQAGGFEPALNQGALERVIDTTLAEALVLGLLRQGVSRFFCVLGHGSTEVGEVLRIYQAAGLVRVMAVRSEIEASHAATALRWVTGAKAAVVTSIGPGAMQALAASLVPASDGLGVWYLFGDETTEDEGPNMQQIPRAEQNLYLRLCAAVGDAYCLHTPQALGTMLRRGLARVDAPHGAGPFFALLPLNTQPARLPAFNLDELPCGAPPTPGPAASPEGYRAAVEALTSGAKVVVKVGGGARGCAAELAELLELADAVAVVSPVSTGLVAYENPRNMLVAGSKGTICGNYATDEAEVLVVVGARGVCQSDSSRTAYPGVRQVININADPGDALHYSKTIPLVGDAKATLAELNRALRLAGAAPYGEALSPWLAACQTKRREWEAFKAQRYERPTLHDEVWGGEVLTQPAAIKIVTDWARTTGAVAFFDAGDVQANGFQVVEDDREGRTYSDSGASYMGFAASALLATAAAPDPFYGVALSGDGSFMMSPQILIDGVEQGATGCVVLLDNRRMAAISSLQQAQYGVEFATNDSVAVDYVAMASAFEGVLALDGGRSPESLAQSLERARAHQGLSLIHVPVYYGPDPLGGLGAYGRWNVGNWVDEVQTLRHRIGL